ncbi:MAG: 50S ribosomal protein L21 [Candidatus Woesebacteria bacterium]|nr:50S ribosomal protein L21 [Candidatus Woesebacteria bacterium]
MDKFAVIRIGGKQYRVSEGEEILVDKLSDLTKIDPEVLLFVDGEKVEIGTPILSKIKVKVKVLIELEKGEKIRVFKYKAKSRERKHIGFRPQYTRLLIEKIS